MKNYISHLNRTIYELVNELKFFEMENRLDDAKNTESQIEQLKSLIDIISNHSEFDILQMTDRDKFHLFCMRVLNTGEVVIEEYSDDMTTDTMHEIMQETKCFDVTNEINLEFLLNEVFPLATIYDLENEEFFIGKKYLVTEE